MQADRSYSDSLTLFEYTCPGQSDSTTLALSHGKVNKPISEVCEPIVVRVAYMNGNGFDLYISDTYIVPYGHLVAWKIKFGTYASEIIEDFFAGNFIVFY